MIRTYLYVPGHRPDRFAKAAASGADAVIVDLEDAVPFARKEQSRRFVAEWLDEPQTVPVWVRVNNHPDLFGEDMAVVAASRASGAVVPKATVRACDECPVPVQALIETAEGVASAADIASCSPVERLGVGEADLCAELGMEPSPDQRELWTVRTMIVLASVRAGLQAPVGPVPTDLDDDKALASSSQQLRRQGFGGRGIIHPRQVGPVNAAFTPAREEVAWARSVIEASESSGAEPTVSDGQFVDLAVVRRARRILATCSSSGRTTEKSDRRP